MAEPIIDKRTMQVTLTYDQLWGFLINVSDPWILREKINWAEQRAIELGFKFPSETLARKLGWTPPEGWEGDPE